MDPILPAPITPRVLPVSSTPMKRDFSQRPAWVEVLASGIWRATANIMAMACSAVVIELPKGVFITMMPFFDATGISTLSTPMPARPITLRLVAAAITFSVAFVADRMARPSYWPITSSSLSLSLPMEGSNVTSMPRSRKIWTAVSLSLSDTRTLGAMGGFLFRAAGRIPPCELTSRFLGVVQGGTYPALRLRRPWPARRSRHGTPSRARAASPRYPPFRPWRRTRSAVLLAHRDKRRYQAPHLRPPAAWRRIWQRPRRRRCGDR